ncbi:hypothetical protein [Gilliamella apicola]|uniref:hypothetical protein n=1 Tax=Gilliamella apicola TaxID=1196095 RepID=UPI002FEE55B3
MNKIKWITQVIAQPYEIQKSLFPDFANVADELAVEWEGALDELNITSITDEQRSVIKKLDDYMLSISGPANIQYWNNTALCKSVEWQRMREMAIDILSIMHWEKTVPAKPKAIYINQDNVSIMS